MDNRRYQELRTYCMGELGEHMNLPGYEDVMHLWVKQNGPFGRIMREEYLARHLFQCIDLTTRERAAAYLLAVITNHRKVTWEREPEPPAGHKQLPPLDKSEADELAKVTSDAVRRFAAFLPEPERAVLIADCEAALEAAHADTPAPAKVGTNEKTWDDAKLRALWEESNQPGGTQESLAEKHGVTRQRIGALLKQAKEKFRAGNASRYGQLSNPRIIKGKY